MNGLDPFLAAEIRVATVVEAHSFPEARIPAIKLHLHFGGQEYRWSSAQITDNYEPDSLPGRQVLALTNVPPRRVAGFKSECLVLGVPDGEGGVVLVKPDRIVPDGGRLY
ncbi:MAG: tRNA-binding protein [Spirochaetaceae bacterium]|nr:MAG: tRNA-binding protein [Spirochaetaceae bacterium]